MSNPNSGVYTFSGRGWGGIGQEYAPMYGQGFAYPYYGGWYAQGAGYGPGVPGETVPAGTGGWFGGAWGGGNENGPLAYGGYGGYGAATTGAGPYAGIGPRNYQRSDERIAEDVNERLTQHGYLNARDIQVSVRDGEVTLTGSVDSRQAKHLATDIADGVPGVHDVYNRLTINSSPQSGA